MEGQERSKQEGMPKEEVPGEKQTGRKACRESAMGALLSLIYHLLLEFGKCPGFYFEKCA